MRKINLSNLSHILSILLLVGLSISGNIYSQENIESGQIEKQAIQFYRRANLALDSNKYDSAIYYYKKVANLSASSQGWTTTAKNTLNISDVFFTIGAYDSAYSYAMIAKAEVLNNEITDSTLVGSVYYTVGKILARFNEVDSAEYFLNLSTTYCDIGLNDSLYSLINKAIGNLKFSQRDFNEALLSYQKSLKSEMSRENPSDALIASLYQNMGIIMDATGLTDSARIYFETSIILKEKIYVPDDPQLAKGYLNFGRFLQIQGDLLEALSYQEKAEKIYYEKFGSEYAGLAPIYWNKGAIYILLNDYDRALSYHERALDLYIQQLESDHYILNEINVNIGLLYYLYEQYELAIEYYNKGLNENLSPESYIIALRNLANCYSRLDKYEQAEEFYWLSINEAEEFLGYEHYITGDCYGAYGKFCNNLGRNREADTHLYTAFKILSNYFGFKNRSVSDVLASLGDLYWSDNNYLKALGSYQKALISYIDNYNDLDIYSNPPVESIDPDINIFQALNRKANTFFDYYSKSSNEIKDLEASLETSLIAVRLFESIMSSYKDEKTKMIINDLNYGIYDLAVIISNELYKRTKDNEYIRIAFEFSEKGKSAVLLSSLRQLEAKEVGSIPDNIRILEQELNRELSVYKNYVSDENQKSEPDSSKIANWKRILFDKTLSYDSLIATIENNHSEYYNLKYSNKVITLDQIQNQLDDKKAFIEYKLTDSLLLVFFVSKDTIILSSRNLEGDFKEKVIDYVSALNKFPNVSSKSESLNSFMNKSQYLYDILLDKYFPLKDYSSLIIVPDDVLGYLSFETLVNNSDTIAKSKFKDFDYLIKTHSIAYSYSGSLLFQHLIKKKHNKTNYLAMAPSYTNIENSAGDSFTSLRDIEKYLIPLQYTVDEVMNIGDVFTGKVLLEDDATEANFKKYASDYSILHFAMHALIDDEDPLASKLIFTLDNDTVEDGFLNTYEIYDLDLNADLAVLSACKTGVGKISKGEGIMSLARGFLYAGVPGIVMTLWEVEDISSVQIMDGFYRNLDEGLPKDVALRNAKLDYLNNSNQLQSHPYFWGAFVQIGDNSPVTSNQISMYIIYGLIVFFLLGVLFVYRGISKKRKRKLAA